MALPHKVVKVTFSGTMFSNAEIWSTGFYMGWENKDADPITDQGIADVSNAWSTFFSTANSSISLEYAYTMCKMHVVAVDGKTVPDSAHYYSPPTAVVGGAGGSPLPPQISLVATLANSLPRGLATKGRMFLPGINGAVGPTGRVSSAVQNNVATNLQTFFNTVGGDADVPGKPVLISTGNSLQLRPGAIRYLSQIRVGDVYDTQRRRRNALQEAYSIKPITLG